MFCHVSKFKEWTCKPLHSTNYSLFHYSVLSSCYCQKILIQLSIYSLNQEITIQGSLLSITTFHIDANRGSTVSWSMNVSPQASRSRKRQQVRDSQFHHLTPLRQYFVISHQQYNIISDLQMYAHKNSTLIQYKQQNTGSYCIWLHQFAIHISPIIERLLIDDLLLVRFMLSGDNTLVNNIIR